MILQFPQGTRVTVTPGDVSGIEWVQPGMLLKPHGAQDSHREWYPRGPAGQTLA